MDDIGNKIYQRRKELGLTLEEVGNAVGVGKSTVRRWENGMIKNMGRDKIASLAKVLQMSPVEFVPAPGEKYIPDVIVKTEDGLIGIEFTERLDALHKNPRLGLLFDRTRKMSQEDVDFMIQMADRILKERGD